MSARAAYAALALAVAERLPAGLGRDGRVDEGGAAARREHTADTLRQEGALAAACDADLCDLALAFEVLGVGWSGAAGAEKSRRYTCAQLGRLAHEVAGESHGTARAQVAALRRAAAAWGAVVNGATMAITAAPPGQILQHCRIVGLCTADVRAVLAREKTAQQAVRQHGCAPGTCPGLGR